MSDTHLLCLKGNRVDCASVQSSFFIPNFIVIEFKVHCLIALAVCGVLSCVAVAIKRRLVLGFLGIQQRRYMAAQQDEAAPAWIDCLGQNDSAELDNALFFDYEYSIDQLMEIAGLCVAQVNGCSIHHKYL